MKLLVYLFTALFVTLVLFTNCSYQPMQPEKELSDSIVFLSHTGKIDSTGTEEHYNISPGSWYFVPMHTHSRYSNAPDCPLTVEELMNTAASEGADAIAITDANTLEQCSDPYFKPTGGCIPIRGMEWLGEEGGHAHAGILGLTGDTPVTTESIEAMIEEATSRNGLVFVNHPFNYVHPWPHDYLDEGIDGIEVWNLTWLTGYNQQAVDWWHEQLRLGKKVTATANSDYRSPPQVLLAPVSYVYAASNSEQDILQAVQSGHVVLLESKNSPRVFLYADVDGDGIYETKVGDTISVPSRKKVSFRVQVTNNGLGGTNTVHVYTKKGKIRTLQVGWGSQWSYSESAYISPKTRDFVRVELRPTLLSWIMTAMTNPIYIDPY